MAYYRVCPECGCTLDPGGIADARQSGGEIDGRKQNKKGGRPRCHGNDLRRK